MTSAPVIRDEPRPIFRDRRVPAGLLEHYRGDPDAIVLGLARGGVSVAWEIAAALGALLDTLIVRKLGVPGSPEFALGESSAGPRIDRRRARPPRMPFPETSSVRFNRILDSWFPTAFSHLRQILQPVDSGEQDDGGEKRDLDRYSER